MRINTVITLIILFISVGVMAQTQVPDSTQQYRIETIDGNEYIGLIVEQTNDLLVLKTERLGTITLRKADIKKMSVINVAQLKNGEYWFENPQSTRYFWQPNAYGLKKGEGYYQNVWILFNQVSIGITDNVSIGAGIVPLFLFAGASSPVWLTPKVSIPIKRDKVNVSAGALMGTILGEENANFGIAYSTVTFGTRDKNLSIGGGYGYAGGDWADSPTFTLSAMIRVGKRGYFLTENYYIGSAEEDLMLFFLGGRRMIKNSGIDFGILIPSDTEGEVVAIPWLGVTFPLGQSQEASKRTNN